MQALSERQDIFKSTMEDKLRLQSRAIERYHDQSFEKIQELEEKKSEEVLLMVQKRYELWRYQNERDEARRLQRSGNSRRVKKEIDLQHPFSSGARGDGGDGVEGDERKRRRCMEAGSRRRDGDAGDQSRCGRG